jgi:histidine triad (HIT) family protein
MPRNCIFCEMAVDPAQVGHRIAESERALAFLDIHPIRKGHALVIPKQHAQDLSDVAPEEMRAVMDLVLEVARRLRKKLGSTGENLLVASGEGSEQSVYHVHVHVIPRMPYDDLRWNDWWQTKVYFPSMPQLETLAQSIREPT